MRMFQFEFTGVHLSGSAWVLAENAKAARAILAADQNFTIDWKTEETNEERIKSIKLVKEIDLTKAHAVHIDMGYLET